jgi:uncharacterized YccA/Bax inhibitor family protein
MFRTSNPMMQEGVLKNQTISAAGQMTVAGTCNKAIVLLAIVVISATYTWGLAAQGFTDKLSYFMFGGLIAGFVLAIVIRFNMHASPVLTPIYAICKGLAIGAISAIYAATFDGIVPVAAVITFSIMFTMLFLYRTGMIRATEKFRSIVMTAVLGAAVFYLIAIASSFLFGSNVLAAAFNGGPIAIGVSLLLVGVASCCFILDFDFIDKATQYGAPKFMEWYGGFALLVTLIWVYLEVLRLLSHLRR